MEAPDEQFYIHEIEELHQFFKNSKLLELNQNERNNMNNSIVTKQIKFTI